MKNTICTAIGASFSTKAIDILTASIERED